MFVIVWVSDEVEEAVASWVEPLVHVMVRSFRLGEQERGTLAPSTTDADPLGLSAGGLNTKKRTLHFTELLHLTFSALLVYMHCQIHCVLSSPSSEMRYDSPEQAIVAEPLPSALRGSGMTSTNLPGTRVADIITRDVFIVTSVRRPPIASRVNEFWLQVKHRE